ncbi:unnamed protein product [Callosobruchus maculatus]|uniref:Thioredoxin domain-containing protein n=1 Tax=Callosobruchus maculatus TaxID=64391 RepID=A0A653C7Z0_CALMS|nr:unnamed protein product [Callosobruchus maculatus]
MYEGATIIYTDGSKSGDKVGSAFITNEQSHYWKLDRASSIFTAELYAIWQALSFSNSAACAASHASFRSIIHSSSEEEESALTVLFSSTESDSDDDEMLVLEIETQRRGPLIKRPRIEHFVERTVPGYSSEEFKSHFRMYPETFEFVLSLVGPLLSTTGANSRPQTPAKTQLLLALWLMATPDSYRSACTKFNVGKATCVRSLRRVCRALHGLAPKFITWPEGQRATDVMIKFEQASGFPKVMGAIDGTHIEITKPRDDAHNSFCNRKGYPSIQPQEFEFFNWDINEQTSSSETDGKYSELGHIVVLLIGKSLMPMRLLLATVNCLLNSLAAMWPGTRTRHSKRQTVVQQLLLINNEIKKTQGSAKQSYACISKITLKISFIIRQDYQGIRWTWLNCKVIHDVQISLLVLCDLEVVQDDELMNLIRNEKYVVVLFSRKYCEQCEVYENLLTSVREELVETLNTWVIKLEESHMIRLYSLDQEPVLVFFRHGIPLLYNGPLNDELLLHTLIENKEPNTKELTDETFEHLTQAATGATTDVVQFLAQKQGVLIAISVKERRLIGQNYNHIM